LAYNRKNYLKRAIKIQAIYMEHKETDVTNRYIFRRFVKDAFNIEENTFYNFIKVKNPRMQLKELDKNKL
jgi:hypothetical protein